MIRNRQEFSMKVLTNVQSQKYSLNTLESNSSAQSSEAYSIRFQGIVDDELKQAELERMDHFKEICRREKEALALFVGLLEQKLDDCQIKVSIENRDNSKTIRFHISPPSEALKQLGLTSGIELGIAFDGTTLPFGFGKPVVKIFGFFNTLANPNAQKRKEPYETISHTGAFKLNYIKGDPLKGEALQPYQNPVDRLGTFIKQIKGESSDVDKIGRSFADPALDARQVKLMIRLVEKNQMMPEFDKMIQRVTGKLKDFRY
jgi:hypothetical protein